MENQDNADENSKLSASDSRNAHEKRQDARDAQFVNLYNPDEGSDVEYDLDEAEDEEEKQRMEDAMYYRMFGDEEGYTGK